MSMLNATKVLRAALFTPTRQGWGLPILFWGKPGIAKSAAIIDIAAEYGLPLELLSPASKGEGAFGVTPMPDADGYISYPPPRWVEKFTEAVGGVVFVDELSLAPPAIQAPMLGLLHDKQIGGAQLAGRVRVIGAANDVQDAAGGWDLAPPTANRLGHSPWSGPSVEEWTEWLMSSVDEKITVKEKAVDFEKRVMAAWAPAWAQARGLVAGFLRANPGLHHKQPPHGAPEASKAWPSPRSWESACRALASATVHGHDESFADMFAAAFVGFGPIGELAEYRAKADLPNPSDLLDGKVKFKPDFKRLDRTYATLMAASSLMMSNIETVGGHEKAKKDTFTMKRFEVFIELLAKTMEGASDICWGPAKQVSKSGMYNASPAAAAITRKMLPLINAVSSK